MAGGAGVIDRETLCDIDAEQALCGIALEDVAAADEALSVLSPEAFYRESHRRIWQAVGTLRAQRSGCDVLTVADAIQAAGHEQAVSADYLAQLSRSAPAPGMATQYAALVREAHARREIVRAAKAIIHVAGDPARDLSDAVSAASDGLRSAADASAPGDGPQRLSDLLVAAMDEIEAVYDGRVEPGLATGVPMLDRVTTGGLRRGEVCVLGARPSTGKSSLAQDIATFAAARYGGVYFASAEMSARAVAYRGLSSEAGIDGRRFRGRKGGGDPYLLDSDWPVLSQALGRLSEKGQGMWVDESSRTMDEIAAQARRLHAREGLSLIVIDHLQHLRAPGGAENRTQAVGRMAAECKDLAVGLRVAVLLLSQLRRLAPGEERKPRLSDLRESGDIEAVADTVLLLHRAGGDVPPPLCEIECSVLKQRDGEVAAFSLWHHRPTGRWYDESNRPRHMRAAGDAS